MSEIVVRRLTLRAAEVMGRTYDRQFATDIDEIIGFTEFSGSQHPTDWRTFVDQELRMIWGQLDKSIRLGIYITALKASNEATRLRDLLAAANKHSSR